MKLLVAEQLNRVSVLVAALGFFLFCAAVFAQPELKVQSDPQPARIGKPYRVSCEVSWTGGAGAYLILPAEITKPDWANVKLSPVKAFVRDGNNIVLQTIELEPTQDGEFEMPAILIPYLRPEDITTEKPETPTHLNAPDAPPKLRADPFPLLVQPHTTPAWLFGVLGALSLSILGAGAAFAFRRRRRPAPQAVPREVLDFPKIHAHLHAAKQYRVNGDLYGVYRELGAAARRIAPDSPLAQTLKRRADDVGYRGLKPSGDQIEGDFRDVERQLAQQQPAGDT